MEKKFDYQTSLHLIKSGLFDIYENQEKILGTIEDEKLRNSHLDDFINLKNIALMLIEGIEYLYEDSENQDVIDKKELEVESSEPENKLENKYYLDCEEEKLPFAYVPEQLFLKLKNHQSILKEIEENRTDEIEVEEIPANEMEKETNEVEEDNMPFDSSISLEQDTENQSEEIKDNDYFYKEDDKKVRGIIVRSDQFMKLALSRRRQEGVLEEAKEFRRDEVKRKRKEEQKKKLEESKVVLNI